MNTIYPKNEAIDANERLYTERRSQQLSGAKYILRRLMKSTKVGPNLYLPSGNLAALERQLNEAFESNTVFLMEPQALLDGFNISLDDLMKVSEMTQGLLAANDGVVKQVEAVLIFICQLARSCDWKDALLALSSLIHALQPRSVTGFFKEVVIEKFRTLFTEGLQEQSWGDSFEWMEFGLNQIRSKFDFMAGLKELPILQKLHNFLLYCLSRSIFDSVGITFDRLGYDKFEQAKTKKAFSSNAGFLFSLFDCLTLFCKQFTSSVKLGSFEPFFHSNDTYSDWIDSVVTLKRHEKVLTNPEPHGFNIFDFRSRLNDALEKGVEIVRYTKGQNKLYRERMAQLYNDLRVMKMNDISRKSAQRDRASPFGVLYFGGSSLGKSTLINITFQYYAARFGFSNDSSSKYTRNPGEAYWNGFTTSQWCIVMDDIAAQNPALGTEDLSLKEIIGVMNNVAYQPDQAAIEDKGKTPVQAKLVIATTNTESLNAHAYFSCPLAVQRRLPWVVEVTVKEEFATNRMLDHSKVAKNPGQYANYWILKVKKIVPETDDPKNKRAKTEEFFTFDDISSYLQWFGHMVETHEKVQALIGEEDKDTASITVCKICSYPQYSCNCVNGVSPNPIWAPAVADKHWEAMTEQTLALGYDATYYAQARAWFQSEDWYSISYTAATVAFWSYIYLLVAFIWWPIVWITHRYVILRAFEAFHLRDRLFSFVIRRLSSSVQARFEPLIIFCKVFGTLSISSYLACKMYNALQGSRKIERTEHTCEVAVNHRLCPTCDGDGTLPLAEQTLEGVGKKPVATSDEKPNVWYKTEFNVTRFDVNSLTSSWRALSFDQVLNVVRNNCLRADIITHSEEKNKRTGVLALGGQLFAINSHAIPQGEAFELRLRRSTDVNGVSNNPPSMVVVASQIYISPNTDVAIMHLRNMPPFKSLEGLLPNATFAGNFNGKYVGYDTDMMDMDREVYKISPVQHNSKRGMLQYFGARILKDTKIGDCGCPMIMDTPHGPVLAGIHALGDFNGTVAAARLYPSDIEQARKLLGAYHIQSGEPMLNSTSAECREILSLDKKSPFRYIDEGSANVYGTLSGWRSAPKSQVDRTCIADSLEQHGFKQKFGAPVMKGWVPWRTAALDMVRIPNSFREDILKCAVDSFTNEIMTMLPKSELEQVHVYDLFTSVNGACGVSYVDKMNRGTSAGFPWCVSKRKFLHSIEEQDGMPDPVEISPEIEERVEEIITRYKKGVRCMPVFMGNLKDEPTKHSKIAIGKTRVFGGAPMDWSIVDRMYLLPVIRLIQNNRYIFESAPGTIAQSVEWQDMFEYLTSFGEDRMIAGDYKAFDKSMPPVFILSAFDIIANICRAAGYTDEELLIVNGLAIDTAFPLFNFNGDLVEFFGSNPSGHPLTVIINGLANALYMRYCYIILNPEHEAQTFKRNVHLMTYGDDNVMGVKREVEWFNHSAIQDILAAHGVTYTMADKESVSRPFINISEVSFLKRTWRWDDELCAHLCPLEYESIEKSLMTCVVSKSVSKEFQTVAIMNSAVNEFFFYGREVFDEKRDFLLQMIEENNLSIFYEDMPFPTWESLVLRFKSYPLRQHWADVMQSLN